MLLAGRKLVAVGLKERLNDKECRTVLDRDPFPIEPDGLSSRILDVEPIPQSDWGRICPGQCLTRVGCHPFNNLNAIDRLGWACRAKTINQRRDRQSTHRPSFPNPFRPVG